MNTLAETYKLAAEKKKKKRRWILPVAIGLGTLGLGAAGLLTFRSAMRDFYKAMAKAPLEALIRGTRRGRPRKK